MAALRLLPSATSLLLALVGASSPARAQSMYGPPPSTEPARSGWTLGANLGLGTLTITENGPGFSVDEDVGTFAYAFHFGGMVTPKVAILAEVWGGAGTTEQDIEIKFANIGLAGQFWAMDRLWFKGGLASARLGRKPVSGGSTYTEPGTSVLLAAGYELLTRNSYALDIQVRATLTGYKNDRFDSTAGALMVGLNWF